MTSYLLDLNLQYCSIRVIITIRCAPSPLTGEEGGGHETDKLDEVAYFKLIFFLDSSVKQRVILHDYIDLASVDSSTPIIKKHDHDRNLAHGW